MKILLLVDTYPTVYQLHRSYKRIKKYLKTSAAYRRAAHRFLNSFKTAKNLEKCSTYRLLSYFIQIHKEHLGVHAPCLILLDHIFILLTKKVGINTFSNKVCINT